MKAVFENFDPNGPAQAGSSNIFGLPSTEENADLVIVPVPWDVTTSYRPGTAQGPELVYEASMQVDLYDADYPGAWKRGIYMQDIPVDLAEKSAACRVVAEQVIAALESGEKVEAQALASVNLASAELNQWVYEQTRKQLEAGKKVALLGGDHSTPYGFVKALNEKYGAFTVLQIDAHADLRQAYEGFKHSHASIMYNIISDFPEVSLMQVGIRDYCDDELAFMKAHPKRIQTLFDRDLKRAGYDGKTWASICDEIVQALPERIYISFDIDGLDPKLCPNTGTPVPGGFEMEQVFYLFAKLKASGKEIIGFDVNEVSCGEQEIETIDPIVGARLLFKLAGMLLA